MNKKVTTPTKRYIRVIQTLVVVVVLGLLLSAGGFAYAASQESHDPFCASCHTQPESTYYQRSIDSQSIDLASNHTDQQARCIDCHSGSGVLGRMQAELLGARNAAAWYTHTAVQPAELTIQIHDENCLKCHQDVTRRDYQPKHQINITILGRRGEEEEAGPNHWHELMARWQEISPSAGSCTSCHSGHLTDGSAATGWENEQTTRSVCEACHHAAGRR